MPCSFQCIYEWTFILSVCMRENMTLRCSGLYQAGDGWTPPAHPPWTHLIWLIFHLTSSLVVFIWKAAGPEEKFIIAKLHWSPFCNGCLWTCKKMVLVYITDFEIYKKCTCKSYISHSSLQVRLASHFLLFF